MNNIDKLVNALRKKSAVIYTGAGVSTNSGIADFRSKNGFYSKYHEDDLAVESYFRDIDRFYIAFQEKFSSVFKAEPNQTHKILAELEKMGYINGIITQNVDRLHQKAGSENVLEFHGNIFDYDLINIIDKQKLRYRIIQSDVPIDSIAHEGIIQYRNGNYVYKPQVVLYGEGVQYWRESVHLSIQSNVHIIIGTSYLVSPFNLLSYENKSKDLEVFVINKEPIEYYGPCTQIIGDSSDILSKILTQIKLG